MSDHEDAGLDDWEEASLAATPAIGTAYADSDVLLKPSKHVPYPERGALQDRTNNRIPPDFRRGDPARDQRLPRRPPIVTPGIPGRRTGVESRRLQNPPLKNGPVRSNRPEGPPRRSYVLSSTWYSLLTNLNHDDQPLARIAALARLRLDEISASTETYIETPLDRVTEINIWGSNEQAAAACDLLRLWEIELGETGYRPHRKNWVKQAALDGRVEERAARHTAHEKVKSQWKAFEESLDHSIELCLLWPPIIGIEDLQQEYGHALRDLEDSYDCRISCNKIHSMIQVFANDESKVLQVHTRLINIGREMTAKRNEVIRANFFRYPLFSTCKDSVQLIKDEKTDLFLPSFCGQPLPENDLAEYEAFSKTANHKTRVKVRRNIEKGLTGYLQLSSKHVRMRVNFLELAFLQYKKPSGDVPYHGFSEYVDMISDERTTFKPQGFRNHGKDLKELGAKLTQHLGTPSTSYSVHFDFSVGSMQKGATLRFECDFKPTLMEDELEKSAQRWLEHKSEAEDDLLLLNVLDFERPGYQIAIRAVSFPDPRVIKGEMDLFARTVEYTPPPDGIKAVPKRRAKFPPGRETLKRVSEMIILRFNFKDEGIFELRRRDSYPMHNSDARTTITTDWSACYYYHDWDNKMGMFADLQPGQDVDFNRTASEFFPIKPHEKVEAGMKRFTNEIEELQTLLSNCIEELPACPEVEEPVLQAVQVSSPSSSPSKSQTRSPHVTQSPNGRWSPPNTRRSPIIGHGRSPPLRTSPHIRTSPNIDNGDGWNVVGNPRGALRSSRPANNNNTRTSPTKRGGGDRGRGRGRGGGTKRIETTPNIGRKRPENKRPEGNQEQRLF